jgi:polyferredoxin
MSWLVLFESSARASGYGFMIRMLNITERVMDSRRSGVMSEENQVGEGIEARVADLEISISEINDRNKRVELDKAWETSWTRKLWLLLITYLLTALVFWIIGVADHWRNAVIPTFAYFLSTLSLPFARAAWEKQLTQKQ